MNLRFIIHILFLIIFEKIKSAIIEIIDNNCPEMKFNDYYYFKSYKIPNTMMRFKANGETFYNNPLKYAFDDNFNSYYKSKSQENSFYNNIEITFSKTVSIDKMLYQAISTKDYQGIGYPTELRIYYKLRNPDGNLSDDESDYLLMEDIISERTGNRVLFIFDDVLICDQIKLEWVEIEQTQSNYIFATASEIMFLVPENEYINKLLFEVFQPNDYTKLNIKPEYNIFIIDELDEKLKEYSDIYDNFKDLMIRARKIINGELKYEKRREFTTNQLSDLNIINQYGDLNSYTKYILKMSRGSTDRQPTGIFDFSNETITIYADGNYDDPLPSIVFTQYVGIYNKWIASPILLKKGVNILKVNNFDITDIKLNIRSGGPIYIENKFTSNEQSQNVKIYIEGGTLFPYFRLNDDEIIFKKYLNEYTLNLNKSRDKYYDIVELYSQNIIITVNASYANEIYNKQGESPQENLLNWDKVFRILLIFDGIQFEEDQPYYDVKNQYITIHIRYSQNYKQGIGAYAYNEHIGIFLEKSFYNALVSYEEIGSTLAHEIGHMIDVQPREYSERTNVVLEEYAVQTIYKHIYNRKRHDIIYEAIAPDNIDNKLRYCNKEDKENCNGFFSNAGDYVYPQYIWWDIESFYPGYWAKLNNLYRYNSTLIQSMIKNEAMIFLTNLILGFDTGYYFERFGLAMSTNPFNVSGASDKYNNSMKEAINSGKISNNVIIKKFWYADSEQYNYTLNNGTGCYKNKNNYKIKIINITLTSNGNNNISLPLIDCIGHLGFEIIENGIVIGFTNNLYFIDKNIYSDDYIPKYKIIAYDRLLDYQESS